MGFADFGYDTPHTVKITRDERENWKLWNRKLALVHGCQQPAGLADASFRMEYSIYPSLVRVAVTLHADVYFQAARGARSEVNISYDADASLSRVERNKLG